jgi:hypothetical protein
MKQISEFFEWIAVGVLLTFVIGVRVALGDSAVFRVLSILRHWSREEAA